MWLKIAGPHHAKLDFCSEKESEETKERSGQMILIYISDLSLAPLSYLNFSSQLYYFSTQNLPTPIVYFHITFILTLFCSQAEVNVSVTQTLICQSDYSIVICTILIVQCSSI
jgi:hypothetical protein